VCTAIHEKAITDLRPSPAICNHIVLSATGEHTWQPQPSKLVLDLLTPEDFQKNKNLPLILNTVLIVTFPCSSKI